MALLPEIDLVHALVPGDLLRRPLDQHFALHQNGDALREAEHQIHVVLDDQDRDVFGELVEDLKAAEEGVDLEGSPQSELHAFCLPRSRDVFPAEHDPAGGGGQHAGEHIDEGGLSGTVRTDKRMARARLQPEIDAGGHGERAEALAQAARLQSGGAHCFLLSFTRSRSRMPSTPPRANITTSTSSVPMPKYQYSGNCLASRSCAIRYTTGPTKAP